MVELSEIVEVALDLLNWEVDKHTSNLRSPLLTHKLLDVLINEFSNERFVVGVLGYNCGEVAETFLVVAVNQGIRIGKGSLRTTLHTSGDDLLRNSLRDTNGLRSNRILDVLGSVVVLALVSVVLVSTLISSGSRSISLIISPIVGVVLGSVVAEVVVVVRHATVELSLNEEENLLDELNGVRSLEEVRVELVGSELLSLVVEISSILSLGLLLLADLGQFIVSNIELLIIDNCSVEALAS